MTFKNCSGRDIKKDIVKRQTHIVSRQLAKMTSCTTLMFIVAISFTPGLAKQKYSLLVNGKEYANRGKVIVQKGEKISMNCTYLGDASNIFITRIYCDEKTKIQTSGSSAQLNFTEAKSFTSISCRCEGWDMNEQWLKDQTITVTIAYAGNPVQNQNNVSEQHTRGQTGNNIKSKYSEKNPDSQQPVQSQGNRAKEKTTSQPGPSKSGTKETNNINVHSEDAPDSQQPVQSQGNGAKKQTINQPSKPGTKETNNINVHSEDAPDSQQPVQSQGNRAKKQTTSQPGPSKPGTKETNNINVHSEDAPAQEPKSVQVENNNDLIVIIVPASICVVLALVVTLVIVVLFLRRKTASRNIQDKGEPTYAVVQDVETKRDYIGTNIDETYAVVNKKQKANKKDVGPQDFNPLDETYAAVNKNKKTNKGDTVASTDPVSNPMAQPKGMHFNMAALREEADGSAVYKKVQKEHGDFSTEDKTQTNSTEGSGRYLNEDGLVYVTVELNPVAPKSTIKPATIVRDERYEPVEYSTIVPGQGAKKDETNNEA